MTRAASAIYEGWVSHRRHRPLDHGFRYRVFMPLLDLDELPEVLDPYPLWSARRPALARVRRRDYLADPGTPLGERARELVAQRLGRRPDGPVRLLAHPRYLGVGFNPVSFLFCHRPGGELDAMIAEVTNTPWGERHAYVLDAAASRPGPDGTVGGRLEKRMHVSPFMGMEQSYEWWTSPPGESLRLGFRNVERGETIFEASLTLRRRELDRRTMRRLPLTYPPMTIATLARIYLQALRLRAKGAPWFARPAAEG
jgi:uncharacterized protein